MSSAARPEADAALKPRAARAKRPAADTVNGASPSGSETPPHAPKHTAEVAHAVHGRVRLKIPAAKYNPVLLDQVKAAFIGLPGVDGIETKPKSGSVVIYYDREHHPELASLFKTMSQTPAAPVAVDHPAAPEAIKPRKPPSNKVDELTGNIEAEAEFLAEHSMIARSVVDAIKELDRQIKRSTNNNIDLKIMVPVALAGVTFLEIGAAAATPMWVTLAIFSMNHFVELHAHDADKT